MEKPVNLFWTSGWDSTFRLLDLLLVQQRTVQPFYVKDHLRKSLHMEIQTMEKLTGMIFKKAPHTKQLLLPTKFKDLKGIKPNEQIQQQYARLKSVRHLGAQYEWLACFAEEEKLYDLELAIETRSPGFFTSYVKPEIIKIHDGKAENFKITDLPRNPDISLFQYFRFPIHELTKLDLQQLAIKHDFIDIMNQTWFCHSPIHEQPCGLCMPCKATMEEGLGRRIPLQSQLRHFVYTNVRMPIKHLLSTATKGKEVTIT
ncbi:hypothetical protein Q0590_24545 [Rhodocytophaga aerolata]|uniref:7-cyano-7-deazaguanine synthase n=1 Tax=Rhodocytophaga aerolata TaxID=455078 RepID=A0ABT8RE07_9BACT|nr:hypothetical protein [Rhodocytophaga aerolata]MDO1449468.1 hypothetical protein [Rhodocytophaga aerolata]